MVFCIEMRHRHDDHYVRLENVFTRDHIPDKPSGATCHG